MRQCEAVGTKFVESQLLNTWCIIRVWSLYRVPQGKSCLASVSENYLCSETGCRLNGPLMVAMLWMKYVGLVGHSFCWVLKLWLMQILWGYWCVAVCPMLTEWCVAVCPMLTEWCVEVCPMLTEWCVLAPTEGLHQQKQRNQKQRTWKQRSLEVWTQVRKGLLGRQVWQILGW